jgi:hypothetical protein
MRIPPAWCTPFSCIKAFVRAHRPRRKSEIGQAGPITDLAAPESITDASVCQLLPLTCLGPDLVEAILDGQQPKGLRLAEMLGNGSLGWEEQRSIWGVYPSLLNDRDDRASYSP